MIYIVTIFMVTMQGGSQFNITNKVKRKTFGPCVLFEFKKINCKNKRAYFMGKWSLRSHEMGLQ